MLKSVLQKEEKNMVEALEEAKQLTIWGQYERTWEWAVKHIPAELIQRLSSEDIAAIVEAFMRCYADGLLRK